MHSAHPTQKVRFFLLLPQVVLALVKWQCYCFVAMNWLIRQPALFRYTRHTLWACNTESHQQQLSACSTYAPHRTHHLGHPYRTRVCVCSVLCVLYGFDITYMNMFSNFPSISVSMVMAQFCHTSMYYDITEWIPLKHFHMPWIFVYFISFIFFFGFSFERGEKGRQLNRTHARFCVPSFQLWPHLCEIDIIHIRCVGLAVGVVVGGSASMSICLGRPQRKEVTTTTTKKMPNTKWQFMLTTEQNPIRKYRRVRDCGSQPSMSQMRKVCEHYVRRVHWLVVLIIHLSVWTFYSLT